MKLKLPRFGLSEEAMLFDSPLYIIKGFVSVFTAYALFSQHPLIGKDMISVLFGMMMTLEPVNVSGIKSGLSQIKASVLGGLVTAIIVSLLGVNLFTIALSVALTMYIALMMNWRFVSPVAIFTAIYMTQYIQLDALGDPSMWLTFRLRMVALATGIVIALFYNYVFSLFFYKSMVKKRLVYIVEALSSLVEAFETEATSVLKQRAYSLITDIDTISHQMGDMQKEKRGNPTIAQYAESVSQMRDLTHQFLDMVMEKQRLNQ